MTVEHVAFNKDFIDCCKTLEDVLFAIRAQGFQLVINSKAYLDPAAGPGIEVAMHLRDRQRICSVELVSIRHNRLIEEPFIASESSGLDCFKLGVVRSYLNGNEFGTTVPECRLRELLEDDPELLAALDPGATGDPKNV